MSGSDDWKRNNERMFDLIEQKRRARLWLRVSNLDQQIENQRIALKSLCDQRGYTVDREYVADGVSAWTGDQRALLATALADARAGRVDVLVVLGLDRITREAAAEILRLTAEIRTVGVGIGPFQEA